MNTFKNIAIVGRPNVGKSRLFNRILNRKVSIVHNEPGVTRDIISAKVNNKFIIMDTGGLSMNISMDEKSIKKAVEEQAYFAIIAADLVLFVVDGKQGIVPYDKEILRFLYKNNKTILLIVNKLDQPFVDNSRIDQFYSLGCNKIFGISAEHGHGYGPLLDEIEKFIGPSSLEILHNEQSLDHKRLSICFAGRPNVGKSSITNCILKENRVIVNSSPGTTRDSIHHDLDFKTSKGEIMLFRIVDTAGIRYKQKIDSSIEYYSSLRSLNAVKNTNVIFLVIDAKEGISKQDKKIAGEILKAGKPMGLIVNKWDYVQNAFEKDEIKDYNNIDEFRKEFAKSSLKELFFLSNTPVIFTSAKNNYSINRILKTGKMLFETQCIEISTPKINKAIKLFLEKNPPTIIGQKRFKIYYALQSQKNPITIKIFCNKDKHLEESYKRYLLNKFNEHFNLKGCPVIFNFISKISKFKN